jgi:predicted O-linked N-acetylglucosamine transferase (SPINDLY family)
MSGFALGPIDFASSPAASARDQVIRSALDAIAANDLERGIALTQQVNDMEPNSHLGLHLVGLLSLRLNEPGKALEAFESAHQLAPEIREHIDALAIAYSKSGRLVDSLFYGKMAMAATRDTGIDGLVPDWLGTFDQAFYNTPDRPLLKEGRKRLAVGDYADAASAFRREVEINRESAEGWRGLAQSLHLDRNYDHALVASEALLSVTSDRANDLARHGQLLAAAGRFDEALVAGREAAALAPDDAAIAWMLVQSRSRQPGIEPAEAAALAESWGRRFVMSENRPAAADPSEFMTRRLRLGILAGHWANGDGLDLFIPVIEHLDRRRVELFVYAGGLTEAPLARRLRTRSNKWQELNDLDDETAAFLVRNDGLDVLIDLDGPLGTDHAVLIAQAPAPHVLAPYTDPAFAKAVGFTGIIGDETTVPAAGARPDILRIDGGLVGQPVDLRPLDAAHGRVLNGAIRFGTLAEGWQIGAEAVAVWHDILLAAPGSTLVLDPARLGGARITERLLARLPQDQVALGESGPQAEYLASIDFLLDPIANPLPDAFIAALAQGCPGITCRAAQPRANLAAGWLDRAGLDCLVADSPAEYRRKAAAALGGSLVLDDFAKRINADRETAGRQAERVVQALADLVNSASTR